MWTIASVAAGVSTVKDGDGQDIAFVTLYARIVYELACNPRIAQESLARQLNVTIRTVQRHLNQLEHAGLIFVYRDRKPFTYEVAWDRQIPYFTELTVSIFQPPRMRHGRAVG